MEPRDEDLRQLDRRRLDAGRHRRPQCQPLGPRRHDRRVRPRRCRAGRTGDRRRVRCRRCLGALDFVGSEILARKDELGALLSREERKTLPEGIGEVARAGQIFKFFAGEALRIPGEKLASVRPDIDCEITREPLGVVGVIPG